jgi:hypothetical protein
MGRQGDEPVVRVGGLMIDSYPYGHRSGVVLVWNSEAIGEIFRRLGYLKIGNCLLIFKGTVIIRPFAVTNREKQHSRDISGAATYF